MCSGDSYTALSYVVTLKRSKAHRNEAQRQRKRERTVHDSSIHPHPVYRECGCGWGMVGAGRMSDLAILPLCVKRRSVVPGGVPYWGSAVGDFSGCLLALLMKT